MDTACSAHTMIATASNQNYSTAGALMELADSVGTTNKIRRSKSYRVRAVQLPTARVVVLNDRALPYRTCHVVAGQGYLPA